MIGHLLFLIPLCLLVTGGLIFFAGMAIFMRNPVVDSSNMFNWLRVVAFCAKHPDELLRMRYVIKRYNQVKDRGWVELNPSIGDCPWKYIGYDEFSEILKVRSPK